MKLVLRCVATEPPLLHIHHLAPVWNNCFIGNPCGGRVICLIRAFWLGPTHVNEDEQLTTLPIEMGIRDKQVSTMSANITLTNRLYNAISKSLIIHIS